MNMALELPPSLPLGAYRVPGCHSLIDARRTNGSAQFCAEPINMGTAHMKWSKQDSWAVTRRVPLAGPRFQFSS